MTDDQPTVPLTTDPPTTEPSGRHPLNIGYLVMGVAFIGLVTVWALVVGDVVDGDDVRWLLPAPWILAGIAGLGATLLPARRRDRSVASGG